MLKSEEYTSETGEIGDLNREELSCENGNTMV